MFPTVSIGPLVLPTAGVVYIIGAWIALSIVERSAKALKLNAEATYGLAAIVLAAGLIGARLSFVVLHWSAYQDNLTGIVWPLNSGFDFFGGLVIALLAGFFYGRAKQLPLWATLDALTPGLLMGLIVISLADFLGGPGYGTETNLAIGYNLFGIRRHAVQFYEIIVALLALFAWWQGYKRRQYEGQLFLLAMAVYAGGRLFVDAFRANSPLTDGGYHIVQTFSLVVLLVCVFLLGRLATKQDASEVVAAE